MADRKRHFLGVCGYGCNIGSPLRMYLNRPVVPFILEKNPDIVAFSGGFTQRKSFPGISESGLMSDYVCHQLNIDHVSHFYILNDAYTTYYNVLEMAFCFRRRLKKGERVKITITCEAQRSPNIIMLARRFMADLVDSVDDITVETASWERADPFKQVGNMIYNWLAIRFPYLARREQKKRIRRAWQL